MANPDKSGTYPAACHGDDTTSVGGPRRIRLATHESLWAREDIIASRRREKSMGV